jgi:sarcosine oxidase, subunit beta
MPFGHADLVSGHYYCKPEGHDMYCLGPLEPAEAADPDSFVESLSGEEGFSLTRAAIARVPAFRDAKLVSGWASLYDVSPDWQPVIGEVAEGLFVDAGTSGHGFKLAPALGAVVADLVMGQKVDQGIRQFHPRRFEAGKLLEAGYGTARILG